MGQSRHSPIGDGLTVIASFIYGQSGSMAKHGDVVEWRGGRRQTKRLRWRRTSKIVKTLEHSHGNVECCIRSGIARTPHLQPTERDGGADGAERGTSHGI